MRRRREARCYVNVKRVKRKKTLEVGNKRVEEKGNESVLMWKEGKEEGSKVKSRGGGEE